ncbi:hypothetical protein LCGC14_1333940 [marine sediment metagenome]|uniref:Uncharacterized protein n=1 Tax=marine sediment metagenome TaxID=412755 RepID=A0A0F9L1S1_9ZZZZ
MTLDIIRVASLKIKFENLLNIIDNAINKSKPIQISNSAYNQKNNNIKFLKWLHKHKIIRLFSDKKIEPKKQSIKSRKRKIEISLQLKALGTSISEIAKRFNVKLNTAGSYLKIFGKNNKSYIKALEIVLSTKGISTSTNLTDFPFFPIRISVIKIKENVNMAEFNILNKIAENNKWIKYVTGQDLGTKDLSILFPE